MAIEILIKFIVHDGSVIAPAVVNRLLIHPDGKAFPGIAVDQQMEIIIPQPIIQLVINAPYRIIPLHPLTHHPLLHRMPAVFPEKIFLR